MPLPFICMDHHIVLQQTYFHSSETLFIAARMHPVLPSCAHAIQINGTYEQKCTHNAFNYYEISTDKVLDTKTDATMMSVYFLHLNIVNTDIFRILKKKNTEYQINKIRLSMTPLIEKVQNCA